MHNKIIKTLKQLSFITAHPDADWYKILTVAIILFVSSTVYGIFLYFDTITNIDSLGSAVLLKPVSKPAVQKEDELTTTVKFYEERKKKNTDLIHSKPESLLDPISS
jgi:hypothetical protein